MTSHDDDPFEQDNAPAVSFKDAPVGTSYTLTVRGKPELVQTRDFETNEPAEWPDGRPKMAAVVPVTQEGEERSLWCQKPSSMFAAVAEAQKQAGAKLERGGTLTVTFSGEKPHENKRFNPIKQYTATYSPPGPGEIGDAFGSDEPPF